MSEQILKYGATAATAAVVAAVAVLAIDVRGAGVDDRETAPATAHAEPGRVEELAAERDRLRAELDAARRELAGSRERLAAVTAAAEKKPAGTAAAAPEAETETKTGPAADAAAGEGTAGEPPLDASPATANELFETLGKMGVYAAQNKDELRKLIRTLKALGEEGIAIAGRWLLEGESAGARFVAALVFEALGDAGATPYLAQSLAEDDSFLVRRMSAHALAMNRFDGAPEPLWRAARDDPDWGVRTNSLYGLAKMGEDAAVDELQGLYGSEDVPQAYRIALFQALTDIASPRSAELFRETLRTNRELGALTMTLGAVRKLKDESFLPELQRLAGDEALDVTIRESAREAYNEIAGYEAIPK